MQVGGISMHYWLLIVVATKWCKVASSAVYTKWMFQFSCAAAIEGVPAGVHKEVWICNTDGYVGHMCLLSLQPEPIVTLNTPVPGCNSRILSICSVPGVYNAKKYVQIATSLLHSVQIATGLLYSVQCTVG